MSESADFQMSEGSDEEIITPMGKNKTTRPFNSDSEQELVTNDCNKNRQRKSIIEQLFVPQDYYNVIKKCRKGNNFILNEMKQEDFISTKFFEGAVSKRVKNSNGETINWLRICWMRFLRNEPYKIFYKISMDENAEFKILDLLPLRGRPRKFENIVPTPLYKNIRQIATAKYKDMIDLLRYIPPEHHDFFKSLPHTQNVDE